MDQQGPESKSSGKTTLQVSLSTLFVAVANQINDDFWRQIATIIAPPIAFGVAFAIRLSFKRYKLSTFTKRIKKLIQEMEVECDNPNTSNARKKELKKEIEGLRKMLHQHLFDDLDIDIG
jgi:hypothetical protein